MQDQYTKYFVQYKCDQSLKWEDVWSRLTATPFDTYELAHQEMNSLKNEYPDYTYQIVKRVYETTDTVAFQ